MNETEQMITEINGFLAAIGEDPLHLPGDLTSCPELDLLRAARSQYTERLLKKVPKYSRLPSKDMIPDMFLEALRSREAELLKTSA